jgi:hypothetical protein
MLPSPSVAASPSKKPSTLFNAAAPLAENPQGLALAKLSIPQIRWVFLVVSLVPSSSLPPTARVRLSGVSLAVGGPSVSERA